MKRKQAPRIQRAKSAEAATADLLFEIGTEELPAAYLPDLIEQLGAEAQVLFASNHLACSRVESFGTPRRLVLLVRGLSGMQHKPAEDIRGPSKQAAYDAAGKPTKALMGFLASRGGTLQQTKLVSSDKGDYVYLVKPPAKTPTAALLPTLLPQLIGRLRAPKTMRWDESGMRFARPIRWLLALYGSKSIRTAWVGGEFHVKAGETAVIRHAIRSGMTTRVGRPQRLRKVRVASIPGYVQTLAHAGIALNHAERRQRIQQFIEREAKRAGGVIAPEMMSHGLLDEVTFLVEQPVALAGTFDRKYLELPREVLLASMAKYQRVFAMQSKSGTLLPRFVAMLDGPPGKPKAVQAVIERILNARLADSLIFWNEDLKRLPLERLVADLSGVTFHEKLGSMAEKTKRLEALAQALIDAWKVDEAQAKKIRQAAHLAKADLVTNLVREFPSLQGVIGKHYALASGASEEIAEALEQQYWLEEASEEEERRHAGRIPGKDISLALAIIEKYDTLASYFGIGIEPTGNADPFGLRPRAKGIVVAARILGKSLPLPLIDLFNSRASFAPFQAMPAADKERIASRIKGYIFERFSTTNPAWSESRDVISAVIASRDNDDLTDVLERIDILHQLKADQRLAKSAKIIERTANILKGATAQPQNGVDPARLQEPLERQLHALYESKKEAFAQLVERKSYAEATALFAEAFYEPLHAFFDQVLVNVDDESLRRNRLALMQAINTLYTGRIADLSKLAILQPQGA